MIMNKCAGCKQECKDFLCPTCIGKICFSYTNCFHTEFNKRRNIVNFYYKNYKMLKEGTMLNFVRKYLGIPLGEKRKKHKNICCICGKVMIITKARKFNLCEDCYDIFIKFIRASKRPFSKIEYSYEYHNKPFKFKELLEKNGIHDVTELAKCLTRSNSISKTALSLLPKGVNTVRKTQSK